MTIAAQASAWEPRYARRAQRMVASEIRELLKLLERRIDAARAGFVNAARTLTHLFHELIAVLRTVAQKRENGEPYFPGVEEALAAAEGERHGKNAAEAAKEFVAHDISYDISK